MRIVFMGSPDFAVPSLTALTQAFDVVGVVTQPDRPAGRGRRVAPPPVKMAAQANAIPLIQPKSLKRPDALDQVREWDPEFIVVAAFGQILPPNVLAVPSIFCVNVHASLLPRWRGAAPIQAAILQGDEQTGVTLMKMDAGLDTGPILIQEAIPIRPTDTAGQLSEKLATLGAEMLPDTLRRVAAGDLKPRPQVETIATFAPMLRKSDGRLRFDRSAEQLARQVRAYDPWPGTHFFWQGRRIAVHSARSADESTGQPAGSTMIHQDLPAVQTADGLLLLERVQPAGSRPMPGSDFLNGAQDFPGDQVDPHPEGATSE